VPVESFHYTSMAAAAKATAGAVRAGCENNPHISGPETKEKEEAESTQTEGGAVNRSNSP